MIRRTNPYYAGSWRKKVFKPLAAVGQKPKASATFTVVQKPTATMVATPTLAASVQNFAFHNIVQAVNVPASLKKFIEENPILTEQIITSRYGSRSLDFIQKDHLAGMKYKQDLTDSRKKLVDDYKKLMKMTGKSGTSVPVEITQSVDEKIAYANNFVKLLGNYKSLRSFQEQDKKKDDAAIARGYANAEQANAMREVEIEWYFKLYGTEDPIEILAYQAIERKKYGETSYEAALAGRQLVPIGSIEQAEIRQDAAEETDQIRDEVAQAEAESRRKKYMYIGIPAALLGAYLLYRYFNPRLNVIPAIPLLTTSAKTSSRGEPIDITPRKNRRRR
jgi:hypothetical protein